MRLKQISKRSLAILLTVLMVFSSLMVGTISTVNSATTDANTSGTNITGGTKLYLKPNANWKEASARFSAYFYNSSGNQWASMKLVSGETEI